jgi:hypothetical protein
LWFTTIAEGVKVVADAYALAVLEKGISGEHGFGLAVA